MSFKKKIYYEIDVTNMIERETIEQELAWKDMISKCEYIPAIKHCYFPLSHWLIYRPNPFDNFEITRKEESDISYSGYLGKIIGEYVLTQDPDFNDWKNILLFINW